MAPSVIPVNTASARRAASTAKSKPGRQSENAAATNESNAYEDDSIGPLPTIDTTRTLLAKLCGRVDDADFNARVVAFTQRMDLPMHAVASVFLVSCLSLFFIANVPARTAMSYINCVTGTLILVFGFASLSWDALRLVLGTFEFWFLLFINTTNNVWFNVLFHDHRMAAMIVTGQTFILSLCADANIYTRRFATRLLVIASPGLLFGLTVTALHFPPDLHYTSYTVFGLQIDIVDLLVNGNLIISYFTAIRVLRSQHLVLSTGPIRRIQCDLYFPVCQLVPFTRRRFTLSTASQLSPVLDSSQATVARHAQPKQQMELVRQGTECIDASHVLLPRVAHWTGRWLRGSWLNAFGVVGFASSLVAFAWRLLELTPDTAATGTRPFPVAVFGLVASSLFIFLHAAHYQRTLFRRVLREIDAWFVSFQISTVTLATCDALAWDTHRMPLIVAAWVWGHWVIFLDALPPVTRRRLALSRRLVLLVNLSLAVYPMLLVYWLYFSPARPFLKNRVVLDVKFGDVTMRVEVLGFLASKLFTLWVWMGRFFWRETLCPVDAFKLLKHRVFYRVGV